MTTPKKETFELSREKECKHSVRFKDPVGDAPIETVYVSRPNLPQGTQKVRLTIEYLDD